MLGRRPRLQLPVGRDVPLRGWPAAVVALCAVLLSPGLALATLGPVLKPNVTAEPPEYVSTQEVMWEGQYREVLRFNGWIGNQGPGRLEIRGRRSSSTEPMAVYQRLYREGAKQTHEENEPDEYEEVLDPNATLEYDTAHEFDRFHLMDIAHYSLWNYAKSEEVEPAEKVGFCLSDDEHVEPGIGPTEGFYDDETFRRGCDEHEPEALSVWEGISVGWSDLYSWKLPLQWTDVSNVAPGEYWLRDDSDPAGFLVENGPSTEAVKHSYSESPVTVRGYVALGNSVADENDEPKAVTLSAESFEGPPIQLLEVCYVSGEPEYVITRAPKHGTLGAVSGDHVTYTPEQDYSGPDSFSFAARNPSCSYPLQPVEATESLSVSAPAVATTTATTASTQGAGTVTGSTSTTPNGGADERLPALSDLKGVKHGRSLILSVRSGGAGTVRLSVWVRGHRVAGCTLHASSGETVRCRVTLPHRDLTAKNVVVWATLRLGRHVLRQHHTLSSAPGHTRRSTAGGSSHFTRSLFGLLTAPPVL